MGEDWTTFVSFFFKAKEKIYTVDEENKTEEVPMPCRPAAYSISSGRLGNWDRSIWLQEDSQCQSELRDAYDATAEHYTNLQISSLQVENVLKFSNKLSDFCGGKKITTSV